MDNPSKFGGIGESITAFFRRNKNVVVGPPRITSARRVPYGPFQFVIQLGAVKGTSYTIEASTDLRHWEAVTSGIATTDAVEFIDEATSKFNSRFFRTLAGEPHQVSNLVGYVSVTVPPGHSMIANPLSADSNRVESLFVGLPNETVLNKFDTALFKLTKNEVKNGRWSNPAETLSPGEGALIFNPTTDFKPVTFAGTVLQGDLSLPIPAGFSIRSSLVPLPGRLDTDLVFPVGDGDVIHLFDRDKQDYVIHSFKAGQWQPHPPIIAAGESFWVGKTEPGNWGQTALFHKQPVQA